MHEQKVIAFPISELVVAAIGTLIALASLFIHDSGIIALALMFILVSTCSLPLAVPLAYTKVGTFWIDIAYIIIGVVLVRYMMSLPDDGAIFFLALLYPLGWAFLSVVVRTYCAVRWSYIAIAASIDTSFNSKAACHYPRLIRK